MLSDNIKNHEDALVRIYVINLKKIELKKQINDFNFYKTNSRVCEGYSTDISDLEKNILALQIELGELESEEIALRKKFDMKQNENLYKSEKHTRIYHGSSTIQPSNKKKRSVEPIKIYKCSRSVKSK